ncbi:hypothetical protein OGATHE_004579 [Ogataea polymorpha]|uniref:Uncharacterized protein n=1 Tax=Ogataea polymorpha TaxID=460523 RepID=A0A9P8T1N6_9ASCO|nr:hypothetical protein OGATHE_004579 [Ogataea polymorpha]
MSLWPSGGDFFSLDIRALRITEENLGPIGTKSMSASMSSTINTFNGDLYASLNVLSMNWTLADSDMPIISSAVIILINGNFELSPR